MGHNPPAIDEHDSSDNRYFARRKKWKSGVLKKDSYGSGFLPF
jgi:hypothetical protein